MISMFKLTADKSKVIGNVFRISYLCCKRHTRTMALTGRTIFLAGGCGTIGTGIARIFLQNGAKVALSSRTQERLDKVKDSIEKGYHSNLILLNEDISTENGAKNALESLTKQGGVQHVVATMGSWWQGGPLSKQSVEEFDRQMNDRARSHFVCAKTFLPYLATVEGSTYTFISGALSEKCEFADVSLIIIGGACLYGIAEAARAEFKDTKVSVNEVRIGMLVKPMLDKDLDQREVQMLGKTIDVVGNDVIGGFVFNVVKARATGVIRIITKKDIEDTDKK